MTARSRQRLGRRVASILIVLAGGLVAACQNISIQPPDFGIGSCLTCRYEHDGR